MALRVEPERPGIGPTHDGGRRHPTIAAVAMLDVTVEASGACRLMALHGLHRETAGEYALVAASERCLAGLQRSDGRLVTAGGRLDLTLLRLGALRHRHFRPGGAASWLKDLRDAHDDVIEMLDPFTAAKRETRRFAEMVAGRWSGAAVAGPRPLAQAQLAVVRTAVTYLHLLAEQRSDPTPLVTGVGALAELILERAAIAPHLAPVLESALFTALAPHPF
ncbi:hypothetical protein [Sphingomonas sp.]|jgi:hypothetical protein|uniref:hypothetical protein n=1 Tax=Sphingomonas sp. TaxID=28214 RepID=UPI002E2FFECF|nr:hypothetical protein [Sphingomonas sp.]HEX4694469.1 hypothetical protein [Sphingomonas sp.]